MASLAGVTLNRRQAIVSAGLIWLVNQFFGFTVRQYPLSAISLLWGLSMGLGTIAVALVASIRPPFSRRSWWAQSLWLGISLLLGFCLYQSGTLLVNQWVQMHGLTADVFLQMLGREVLWSIALFAFYTALVLSHQRNLQQTLR
ncbi:hypothetical protein [Acaryochloris marina]|uniref:hypothetical protein n=1 Tax=Acaryochloris marina TaxID=155978 RepID=UPI0021C32383|nr:hypothetical protein [Acaryochloris marina]BDM83246.1 hypothetical protein AM10699_61070 [Acaryochloris marina MBIC10699]